MWGFRPIFTRLSHPRRVAGTAVVHFLHRGGLARARYRLQARDDLVERQAVTPSDLVEGLLAAAAAVDSVISEDRDGVRVLVGDAVDRGFDVECAWRVSGKGIGQPSGRPIRIISDSW